VAMRIEINEIPLPVYGPLFVWRVLAGPESVSVGMAAERSEARRAARKARRALESERFAQALIVGGRR